MILRTLYHGLKSRHQLYIGISMTNSFSIDNINIDRSGGDFSLRVIGRLILTTSKIKNEDQIRVNKTQHKKIQRILRENS